MIDEKLLEKFIVSGKWWLPDSAGGKKKIR
jgi:hypothetical protein